MNMKQVIDYQEIVEFFRENHDKPEKIRNELNNCLKKAFDGDNEMRYALASGFAHSKDYALLTELDMEEYDEPVKLKKKIKEILKVI